MQRLVCILVCLLITVPSAAGDEDNIRLAFSQQFLYRTPLLPDNSNQNVVNDTVGEGRLFGIFINTTLYWQITDSINTYITDLESDGWQVVLYTAEGGTSNKSGPNSWTTEDFLCELEAAQQLRELLKSEYDQGMVGCIFIGELPAAWFSLESEEVAKQPIDLYFRDMDGIWEDTDNDGLLDEAPPNEFRGPEIWLARLYVPVDELYDEIDLMSNYFRKNHAYRTGNLALPRKALDYIDDYVPSAVCGINESSLSILYDDVTLITDNQITCGSDYKQRLIDGYELIRVTVHGGLAFLDTPDYATAYVHTYVHSPTTQAVQLRLGSDDAIKVWLNGDNVHTSDVCRSYAFDQDVVDVILSEGWNRLLIKLNENCGDWRFSARFTNNSGQNLSDLIFQLNNPDIYGDAPFIKSWLINGFYYDPNTSWWNRLDNDHLGGESDVNAIEGQIDGNYAWMRIDSDKPYIDLNTAYPEAGTVDFGVSYAFVHVYSPVTQAVELWLGSDDGIKIWLNGELIGTINEVRGWSSDQNKIEVTLQSGWNRLLVKVSDYIYGHGLSARFAHPDGTAIEGLEYDPSSRPVRYIKSWLINGWYKNPDKEICINTIDYLDGEAQVSPSEGDENGSFVWEAYYSDANEINLNWDVFGKHVDEPTDLMAIDPCCFFFDGLSCGSFAWWQGWIHAEVFSPTYGLASWGMLWDTSPFYRDLTDGKCFGQAQLAYLQSRVNLDDVYQSSLNVDYHRSAAYFGMFGDPTLAPGRPREWSYLYVDADARGENNGQDWKNAYNVLQDALTAASWGTEVRVAQGTYWPDLGASSAQNDRSATFQLKNGVVIKGGYAGIGALNPNIRDISLYETILGGNIGTPDVNDNSYHIVTAKSVGATAVLNGFTITSGNANGSDSNNCGGGIYIDAGSPKVNNCTIKENSAGDEGGGIFNYNGGPILSNCTFSNNSAPNHRGGGMSIVYGCPSLINCTFRHNSATWAGGLYCTSPYTSVTS